MKKAAAKGKRPSSSRSPSDTAMIATLMVERSSSTSAERKATRSTSSVVRRKRSVMAAMFAA